VSWKLGHRSTPELRKARVFVLSRDKGICGICEKPGATILDHKLARALGGTNELSNLQAAHPACNARKAASVESKLRYSLRKRTPEAHPGAVA
jgi:5-methylcytosine-specific restriction endonuclease McrA